MRVALPLFAWLVLVGVAAAEEPQFEGLGQAPVVAGDTVRARERALEGAMRQAVEQAAATLYDPETLSKRSSELRLRVLPRARTYVTNYRVLEEGDEGGLFQVHIQAQVATQRILKDLDGGAAPSPVGTPPAAKLRAAVCANLQVADATPAWLRPPADDLERARKAVDLALRELFNARDVEPLNVVPTCTVDAAAQSARAAGGQGALVATLEPLAFARVRGSRFLGAEVALKLRLLSADGGVAAESSARGSGYGSELAAGLDKAARAALTEAALPLHAKLAERWSAKSRVAGAAVRVVVAGLARHQDLQALTRVLSTVPGVAAVELRRIARGEIELLARTSSSAALIAQGLARVPQAGLRLTAHPAGDDLLEIQLGTAPEG
jgi:hypothetical protein